MSARSSREQKRSTKNYRYFEIPTTNYLISLPLHSVKRNMAIFFSSNLRSYLYGSMSNEAMFLAHSLGLLADLSEELCKF